jgi:hypothetical protein
VSDNRLRLVPIDPEFVPDNPSAARARDHLAALVPDADQVTQSTAAEVQFVDPGANLEQILCPRCGQEIAVEWWQHRMDDAYGTHNTILIVTTPCCGATVSLNDLNYEWPAGFARFVLEAANPGVAELPREEVAKLGEIVGSPLRVIWAHY